jgi:hypothetical protein
VSTVNNGRILTWSRAGNNKIQPPEARPRGQSRTNILNFESKPKANFLAKARSSQRKAKLLGFKTGFKELLCVLCALREIAFDF